MLLQQLSFGVVGEASIQGKSQASTIYPLQQLPVYSRVYVFSYHNLVPNPNAEVIVGNKCPCNS